MTRAKMLVKPSMPRRVRPRHMLLFRNGEFVTYRAASTPREHLTCLPTPGDDRTSRIATVDGSKKLNATSTLL